MLLAAGHDGFVTRYDLRDPRYERYDPRAPLPSDEAFSHGAGTVVVDLTDQGACTTLVLDPCAVGGAPSPSAARMPWFGCTICG